MDGPVLVGRYQHLDNLGAYPYPHLTSQQHPYPLGSLSRLREIATLSKP